MTVTDWWRVPPGILPLYRFPCPPVPEKTTDDENKIDCITVPTWLKKNPKTKNKHKKNEDNWTHTVTGLNVGKKKQLKNNYYSQRELKGEGGCCCTTLQTFHN